MRNLTKSLPPKPLCHHAGRAALSLSLACCGLDMCVRGSASSSSSPSFSSFERPTQLSCKIPPRNSIHRDKKGLRAEGKTNKEKNGRFGRSPRYISGGGGGKEGACHIAARPMVQLFGQEGDGGERGAPPCHTNYGKVTPPLQGAPRDVATSSKCSFCCSSVWHRSPSPWEIVYFSKLLAPLGTQ